MDARELTLQIAVFAGERWIIAEPITEAEMAREFSAVVGADIHVVSLLVLGPSERMAIGDFEPVLGRPVAEGGEALNCPVDVLAVDAHVDVHDRLRGKARHRGAADVLHASLDVAERRLDSRA